MHIEILIIAFIHVLPPIFCVKSINETIFTRETLFSLSNNIFHLHLFSLRDSVEGGIVLFDVDLGNPADCCQNNFLQVQFFMKMKMRRKLPFEVRSIG